MRTWPSGLCVVCACTLNPQRTSPCQTSRWSGWSPSRGSHQSQGRCARGAVHPAGLRRTAPGPAQSAAGRTTPSGSRRASTAAKPALPAVRRWGGGRAGRPTSRRGPLRPTPGNDGERSPSRGRAVPWQRRRPAVPPPCPPSQTASAVLVRSRAANSGPSGPSFQTTLPWFCHLMPSGASDLPPPPPRPACLSGSDYAPHQVGRPTAWGT
jgi:hypothetical protein